MILVPNKMLVLLLFSVLLFYSQRPVAAFVMPASTPPRAASRPSRTAPPSQSFSVATATSTRLYASAVRSPRTLALAGKLFSTMKKLVCIGPSDAKRIASALVQEAVYGDIAILSLLAVGAIPVTRFLQSMRQAISDDAEPVVFEEGLAYKIARGVKQLSTLGGAIYAVDMLGVILRALHFKFAFKVNFGTIFGQIAITLWAARALDRSKQSVLCKRLGVDSVEYLGRSSFYDRVLRAIIYSAASLVILDVLSIKTGRAITSVFALGGLSTLALSLACKDLVADLVSGLALNAADKFHEGENVHIGNDIKGIVKSIGWMNTVVRGYDEIETKIPNSLVTNQRTANISRIDRSQVKQSIFFDYSDIEKIPQLVGDIKSEIDAACPKLIRDGSRPFNCHWREFHHAKLEVVVDAHFAIRAFAAEYWDARQRVLEAIARSAKKNNVKFAVPILSIRSDGLPSLPLPAGTSENMSTQHDFVNGDLSS